MNMAFCLAAPRFPAEIYTGTEFANKSAVKTTKSKKVGASVCFVNRNNVLITRAGRGLKAQTR
jgi:hypothetical protein